MHEVVAKTSDTPHMEHEVEFYSTKVRNAGGRREFEERSRPVSVYRSVFI